MRQPKEEQRERWRGLLSEHKNSGQSVATFCRERGLGAWQFYEWKKRRRPATTEPFLAVELVAASIGSQPMRQSSSLQMRDNSHDLNRFGIQEKDNGPIIVTGYSPLRNPSRSMAKTAHFLYR